MIAAAGHGRFAASSTSSADRRIWTARKPSRARPRSERRSSSCWRRMTCGPNSRSGRAVAFQAHLFGHIEHDGDRKNVVRLRQFDHLAPGVALHIGRVDDGEPSRRETFAGDEVQHLERVLGGGLVVLVPGDQAAAEIAGDHLETGEVPCSRTSTFRTRRRRPAPPGQLRDRQAHLPARFGNFFRLNWCSRSFALGDRRRTAAPLGAGEDGELGGRPELRVDVADGGQSDRISHGSRDRVRPLGEFRPGPFEAVVRVPEPTGASPLAHVVFRVGRRHQHRPRPGMPEHRPLQARQPRRVEVLDDLHQHRGVEPGEAVVTVGQGRLPERQPGPLTVGIRSSCRRRSATPGTRRDVDPTTSVKAGPAATSGPACPHRSPGRPPGSAAPGVRPALPIGRSASQATVRPAPVGRRARRCPSIPGCSSISASRPTALSTSAADARRTAG